MISLLPIIDGEDKSSPFKNCVRKNYAHLKKWAKRCQTDCFRIYDCDMPWIQLAIDYYAGRFCIHYFSKNRLNNEPPSELIEETNKALIALFGIKPQFIHWRTRLRRKKLEQYEKADQSNEFFTVQEYGVKFKVNLVDYLDTGLFLDHRETRKLVTSMCREKRVLNLFAYTCSFSVHAALAGASFTKSIDISNTYTAWGQDNFILNGISLKNHEIVRADCLKFLAEERSSYDLIIIDPPTISRSKKMEKIFDIQVDYKELLMKAIKLLNEGGMILFSTNSRKFIFDATLFESCEEISKKTLPIDFRDPKIHHCWKISTNGGQTRTF